MRFRFRFKFNCLLQKAVLLQSHLDGQESKIIGHCKHHLLHLCLELFHVYRPICIMIELKEQRAIDMGKLIRICLEINAKVGLQDPQALQFLQHFSIRKKPIMVRVEAGKPVFDQGIESFLIFHQAKNCGTI